MTIDPHLYKDTPAAATRGVFPILMMACDASDEIGSTNPVYQVLPMGGQSFGSGQSPWWITITRPIASIMLWADDAAGGCVAINTTLPSVGSTALYDLLPVIGGGVTNEFAGIILPGLEAGFTIYPTTMGVDNEWRWNIILRSMS